MTEIKNGENMFNDKNVIKCNDLNISNIIRDSIIRRKNAKEEMVKNEKQIEEWSSLSIFQKAKKITSQITVEPILACYVMPSVLSAIATQNLYLEKACRVNLGFAENVCDALSERRTANYTLEEEAVQQLVATITGWKTVLQSLLPCIVLIFLGSYSDRVGQRKVCMLLPIVGEFLTSIGLIINNYFFYELSAEVAAVTESIFPAVTGGWFTMFMGVFSYIADVTTEEERTLRIGIVNLFYSVGIPVGAALSGILVREIGLYGVFSLSASLYIFSFMYGFFRIKELKKPGLNEKPPNSCCSWLHYFFDIRYVKETFMVAFKRGPNRRRQKVIMLILVLCVVIGPVYGEMSVMYLFTRYRFNWNEVDYSVFSTYGMCTSLLGTLFSVGIFSHVLQIEDSIIGVISTVSKIAASFMYAFATKSWQIYLAPLIEIFSGTSFIAMRAIVSKLVDKDEQGKVNSVYGVAEAMMPLIYAPMYTMVYSATIKTFPGAFFLLGGALTVPAVMIFFWFYTVTRGGTTKEGKTDNVEKCNKNGVENKAFEADERQSNKAKGTVIIQTNVDEEETTNSSPVTGSAETVLSSAKF